ncbi:hypothetical protein AVEN_199660-1 [Araneus ventricosus]|uniref:Uncharacterized protein n=1 Tax=Araneus ventricosus TaxID=182803 RepID=A0A4Y2DHB2_ARAVE|nr:hypothetical protein AVEN_199660-1 [Araneus ventricosus]
MALPAPVSQNLYDKINDKILCATTVVANSRMKKAAKEEELLTGSSVIMELELNTDEHLVKVLLLRDKQRIKLAEKCCQKATLESRKAKKRLKTAEKTAMKSEGKMYASGAF